MESKEVKTQIKIILYQFLQDGISSDEAVKRIIDVFNLENKIMVNKLDQVFIYNSVTDFLKLCDPKNKTLEKQADLRFGFIKGVEKVKKEFINKRFI